MNLDQLTKRECLLEMKRVSDEYAMISNGEDLFTLYEIDPTSLYTDTDPVATTREMTIPEPNPVVDFYQYGVECRYLPLYRYLQLSKKTILSSDWQEARRELLFSKAFERLLELYSSRPTLNSSAPEQDNQKTNGGRWSKVLSEARILFLDLTGERQWKRQIAKRLAEEAIAFLKLRFHLPQSHHHYPRSAFNYLDRDTVVLGDTELAELGKEHHGGIAESVSLLCSQFQNQKISISSPGTDPLPPFIGDNDNNSLTIMETRDWSYLEDNWLKRAYSMYAGNLGILGSALDRSPEDVLNRLRIMSTANTTEPAQVSAGRHYNFIASVLAGGDVQTGHDTPSQIRIKQPMSLQAAAKKLFTAHTTIHPSHEAAVRRANQNINKLLTPGELALKRLQRNRGVINADLPSTQV